MAHAKLSPSSSSRWTLCPAAPSREAEFPNESNAAADWGTVCHDLSERCLKAGDYSEFKYRQGQQAVVNDQGAVIYLTPDSSMMPGYTRHAIDDEMIECVTTYVDFVRQLAQGGELMVEQRLSIEHITGEVGAEGTSDSVILFDDEICIVDLKGGVGVQVFASEAIGSVPLDGLPSYVAQSLDEAAMYDVEDHIRKPNTQLLMYADAALQEFGMFGDFKRVRIIVVQPRLGHTDEHVMPIEEHHAWVQWVRERAAATRESNAPAVPGEKQCHFCRAKASCPELQQVVFQTALDDFTEDVRPVDTHDLGTVYTKLPLIRGFCKAIEERVRSELAVGRPVAGYKLVDGREGNRKWSDESKIVGVLQAAGLKDDQIYDKSVITPPTAEKRLKKHPEAWERCQALIKRAPPTPTVVHESDPRPALSRDPASDFDDESIPADVSEFF